MKPLTCLIVLFLLISCKKDALQTDLELSREIWLAFKKSAKEWLRADPEQNMIYFEVKNRGMISTCGYVKKGCMDDCFTGIKISNISAEQNVR